MRLCEHREIQPDIAKLKSKRRECETQSLFNFYFLLLFLKFEDPVGFIVQCMIGAVSHLIIREMLPRKTH